MTTFVHFDPPPGQGFAFQATLDGASYRMLVTWNVFGQRWFISCRTGNDELIFHMPVISSPQEGDINLAGGYFLRSTLVFRDLGRNFEISP